MECTKNTPQVISTELITVSGENVTVTQRQLTTAELWRAEELSGAKPDRFNKFKLADFMARIGKTDMHEMSQAEREELYSGDIWESGDDSTTPAGRKQLLYQIAFSMGWEGNGPKLGEGWTLAIPVTPENILNTFSESQVIKLIQVIAKLRQLDYAEEKNS